MLLFINPENDKNPNMFYFLETLSKDSMNPFVVQITTNIQLKPNHPMYLFNQRITMDIQFKLNHLIYLLDETHRISNFCKVNNHNQSDEFNRIIEMKVELQTLFKYQNCMNNHMKVRTYINGEASLLTLVEGFSLL
jgi:hypothetical protein